MNDEPPAPLELDPAEFNEPTQCVEAVVFVVIPTYHQAKVRDANGNMYALTRKTRGIDLNALYEGQRVDCLVTLEFPRVLRAIAR